MEDLLKRITINQDQNFGKPSIRGMRIRVEDVLGMLAAGDTAEDILEGFPYLEADDIRACLAWAYAVTSRTAIVTA